MSILFQILCQMIGIALQPTNDKYASQYGGVIWHIFAIFEKRQVSADQVCIAQLQKIGKIGRARGKFIFKRPQGP